jgi:hypothetical protein
MPPFGLVATRLQAHGYDAPRDPSPGAARDSLRRRLPLLPEIPGEEASAPVGEDPVSRHVPIVVDFLLTEDTKVGADA